MDRDKVEHLLRVKLTIEQVQLLVRDFIDRYDTVERRALVGIAGSIIISKEVLCLMNVEGHLKNAVTELHRAVNQEEV
jgi:hypothetical protein